MTVKILPISSFVLSIGKILGILHAYEALRIIEMQPHKGQYRLSTKAKGLAFSNVYKRVNPKL